MMFQLLDALRLDGEGNPSPCGQAHFESAPAVGDEIVHVGVRYRVSKRIFHSSGLSTCLEVMAQR